MYNIAVVQATTFHGCYRDSKTDRDQTSFSLHSEDSIGGRVTGSLGVGSSLMKERKSLRGHVGRITLTIMSLTPSPGFYSPLCTLYLIGFTGKYMYEEKFPIYKTCFGIRLYGTTTDYTLNREG